MPRQNSGEICMSSYRYCFRNHSHKALLFNHYLPLPIRLQSTLEHMRPPCLHLPSFRCNPLSTRRTASHTAFPKLTLSLEAFLLRQRVLHLYRGIIRSCHRLPDETTRREMRVFAREEFERQKEVKDQAHIKYLLSVGKADFDKFEKQIGGRTA